MAFNLAGLLNMRSRSVSLDIIAKHLVKRGETLAVAESVTSGNLQAALSLATKATEFFQGGITAYNTGQKSRHLHVDPITADRTNCVSEDIARSMAQGACKLFSSNWGIAVTGYAAPVPALKVKNELFAWYSIAYNNQVVITKKIVTERMTMKNVQTFFVRSILSDFADHLAGIYDAE